MCLKHPIRPEGQGGTPPWKSVAESYAEAAFHLFVETFRAKYAAAVSCLEDDRVELLAFYDFPAEES